MNMKNQIPILILGNILVFFLGVAAQDNPPSSSVPVDKDSGKIMYREVVNEPGNPGYLYNKAMEWFNYYYINPTSIFNIQDKLNGKIEGTARMILYRDDEEGNRKNAGLVMYKISLEFKEDKYRYTLTDFLLKTASRYPLEKWLDKQDPAYNVLWDSYLYQIDTTMVRLTETLREKMKPVEEKVDEW